MSQDFADLLGQAEAQSAGGFDPEMPFLDAYKKGGTEAVERLEQEQSDVEPDADDDREGPEAQRGGSGGDQPAGVEAVEASADAAEQMSDPVEVDEQLDESLAAKPDEPTVDEAVKQEDPPVALQMTDHQDAVQAAATKGGSGGTDEAAAVLPSSGFRIGGVERQPHIRSLPDGVVDMLREKLRAAAVRELGVADAAARDFSERVSQGTLVTAFLLAQLDVRLDVDPATQCSAELFRSADPLLGAAVARLEALEAGAQAQDELMRKMRTELREVRETSGVVEQALAYSIADREENLTRGEHNAATVPLTHKSAMGVRDRMRELTKKQQQVEKDRDGRPIR